MTFKNQEKLDYATNYELLKLSLLKTVSKTCEEMSHCKN